MHNAKYARPNSMRTDESNEFAHHTMSVRLPLIIDELIEENPDYPSSFVESLRKLREEVVEDRPIRSIAVPAPDWGSWEEQVLRHRGETWLHSEWFYAEHLFYRRIVESVRWWETGRDPFAPIKASEYSSTGHRELLQAAVGILDSGASPVERLESLLLLDLWGNRIDLSYKASAALGAGGAARDDLIMDERGRIVDALLGLDQGSRSIHIVTDNAGSELTMDLLLADLLVSLGFSVSFHVKMHPTYVGDTTAPDILSFIRTVCEGREGPAAAAAGRRLDTAFLSGSIRIYPDLYWNSGRFIGELPPRIVESLRGSRLVVFKGDVNYRRLSRDAAWAPEAGFAEVVGTFPAPAAVLRTMKSDTVFGLPPGTAERLDAEDPRWKTNGRRGLIQYFA